MGSFDISRINFNAEKHYASVRMQQGRVLTDDDWNENEKIENEDRRRTRVDIIGPYGSPDNGFKIEALPNGTITENGMINFLIRAGVIYLGGWRFELEEDTTYRLQKDWLQQAANLDPVPGTLTADRFDLVYLETWLQPVSAVEDSSLLEAALGGPDTTTRIRAMQRVHLASDLGYCDCADAWQQLISQWTSTHFGQINKEYERTTNARLRVTYSDTGLPEDLCTPTAAGGYLGAENQAIRVQLIDGTHFTWGFDDASPYYRITVSADGKTVQMITEPKDQYHWPLSSQVIEILPWSAVLPNGEKVAEINGHLTKVEASYNPDTATFTLADALPAGFGAEWKSRADAADLYDDGRPREFFYARVWSRGNDLNSPAAIPFVAGTPVALGNTGLQVTITGDEFLQADHWVIAARPETPTQVVPWELEGANGIAPHGYRRFYAPLAVIRWQNIGRQLQGAIMHDCRKKFNPLTEPDCCCTYTVGDGIRSKGDYSTIQEAVDALPAWGGKICVLPGEHTANVLIRGRRQIRISGCGDQTIVRPGSDNFADPVFTIQNSQRIQIDQLTIVAIDGIGIHLQDDPQQTIQSENITIDHNKILAGIQAVHIHTLEDRGGANNIEISYNKIGMIDQRGGRPAIFSVADDVLIERNRIVVVPEPNSDDPDDPRDPNDPGDPFNPCRDKKAPQRGAAFKYQVYVLLRYVTLYKAFGRFTKEYLAIGGIQIGGTSEKVWILENEIIGGRGNGITLGHITESGAVGKLTYNSVAITYSTLYDIKIDGNIIQQMGLNGISSLFPVNDGQNFVQITDLTVFRNLIEHCAIQLPAEVPTNLLNDIAFGGIVLSDCENGRFEENRIENNGRRSGDAICGIFILQGEKIGIKGNTIINNGLPIVNTDTVIKPGARAGIMVKMAFKLPQVKRVNLVSIPSFDAVPAVTVYDNIVEQPLGHALYTSAFGPVSVVSNQFSSLGTDRTNALSRLASTVLILNLGVSKDLPILTNGFLGMGNKTADELRKQAASAAFQRLLQDLRYLPSGKVLFNSNQCTLDMRAPTSNLAISSLAIVSLDDVSFNANQSECVGFISTEGDVSVDIVLVNTWLMGASIRSNDNRFTDVFFTLYSLFSYGLLNTATGNQSTHCLFTEGVIDVAAQNIVLLNDRCSDGVRSFSGLVATAASKKS